jgi:hypothetical protein
MANTTETTTTESWSWVGRTLVEGRGESRRERQVVEHIGGILRLEGGGSVHIHYTRPLNKSGSRFRAVNG